MTKRRFRRSVEITLIVFLTMAVAGTAHAAHPLISDDTGIQGKGRFQLEFIAEYGRVRDDGVVTKTTQLGTTLSYGIADSLDFVLGVPYQQVRTEDRGTFTDKGITDISIEGKWLFHEKEGLSLALKPGITLPTGNDQRGLGTGRMTYHLFLISTKEVRPWEFHLNLGYIRNENRLEERRDLWHVSLATVVEAAKGVKLAGNIGLESNTAPDGHENPGFILGGVIYSLSENIDIDLGIKSELHRLGTDYAILSGLAWRF